MFDLRIQVDSSFFAVNRIFEKETEVLRRREYAEYHTNILLYLLNLPDLKKVRRVCNDY